MKNRKLILIMLFLFQPSIGYTTGWCEMAPGSYSVISHGTVSDKVWLIGNFVGQSTDVWIPIADATQGATNVAIALAAQLAEKPIEVYLDGANDTCANYVTWTGVIRHVKVKN